MPPRAVQSLLRVLLTLLLWTLLLASGTLTGAAVFHYLGTAADLDRWEDRLAACAWTGLLVQATILLYLAIITPVAMLGWLILILPFLFLLHPALRQQWLQALPSAAAARPLAAVLLSCAAATSGVVMLFDTGLYHYQLLRWLADTGATQGMASIDYRMGFSSSWLALAAVLDSGFWQGRGSAVANGLLFALIVFHLVSALSRLRDRCARPPDWMLIAGYPVVLALCMIQRWQVSASPNLPVAGGILLAGWLLASSRGISSLVLASAVASVKLTAWPLLLVVSLARRSAIGWVIAALLAGSVVDANSVATGCPLFPSALWCADTPQSIDVATAQYVERETRDWARYLGRLPKGATWGSLDWLPGWLLDPGNGSVMVLSAVALIAMGRRWNAAAIAGLVGLIATLATSPDFRYGIGYIALLAGCAVSVRAPQSIQLRLPAATLACAAVLIDAVAHEAGYLILLHEQRAAPVWSRLVIPPPILIPPFANLRVNDVEYSTPQKPDMTCWGAPRPCAIHKPPPTLHWCDPVKKELGGLCRGPH